jgi:8-oxo-dGTP pyrophosphatase MutT (NUDIX family)
MTSYLSSFDFTHALENFERSPWNHSLPLYGNFQELLRKERAFFRDHFDPGHFTGSSFVFDFERERALLMHHKKLDIWVQPGGHADGDDNLLRVAHRELWEECGLAGLSLAWNGIFDLDRHNIPERASEAAHQHFDVRFLWKADCQKDLVKIDRNEVKDTRWLNIAEAGALGVDTSVKRLFEKALALKRYRQASAPGLREVLATNI